MKKLVSLMIAVLFCLTCFGAMAEGELNIYTWATYIDEETLVNFETEYGITVNYYTFEDNDEMLLKLQNNGGSEYDIVLASDYVLSIARTQGLLQPLNMELLTNYGNLNPAYLNQFYDPDGAYTIPYTAGSPMIVYNPEMVEGEITSFADLWDEQFVDSLGLLDNARVMLGATLRSMGYSYNTTDEAVLAEAAERLNELAPNVHVLDYNTPYAYLLSGEVSVAYMFTPYVVIAQMENPNLVAVYPEEGIGFGIDAMVIPVNAPNVENAHLFLNYLMRPEVAAHVAEMQWYANPNAAAAELIDPSLSSLAALNIPEELNATKEFVEDIGEFETIYQDIWTNFKLSL